jgi:hypothetical protein
MVGKKKEVSITPMNLSHFLTLLIDVKTRRIAGKIKKSFQDFGVK